MDTEELENDIRSRVVMSGRVLFGAIAVSVGLFSMILGSFFIESFDSELEAANYQVLLFVYSNTENFEMQNTDGLKKSARNLIRSPLVSHIAIFDPLGRTSVWLPSLKHGDADDTENVDMEELVKVQNKSKLMMVTTGSNLMKLELPSGKVIYRAYTPVTAKRGTVKMGEIEIGFFQSEILARTLQRLRIPGSVATAGVLLVILLAGGLVKQLEKSKTADLTKYVTGQLDRLQVQYERKISEQKKEKESKDVDGGSFFNIMEAVRDISGATDLPTFIRRSVLSSVRLFRCRVVSFYVCRSSNGSAPAWELGGRYDGKGYAHDLQETLDLAAHTRLKEALSVGATELLQGYPSGATQALLIGVSAEKPLGAIILHNKVGTFDNKDLLAARIFSGFLPNLLAWHVK